MTQQEAEALTNRLTRIWTPKNYNFEVNSVNIDDLIDFDYRAKIKAGTGLMITLRGSRSRSYSYENYQLYCCNTSTVCNNGECYSKTDMSHMTDGWQEREQAFATQMDALLPSRLLALR